MNNLFNSPLEVGVRVLTLLVRAFPSRLDINHLVFLDHALLHSADLNGPESLHPPIPIRVGEFGVKRQHVRDGLSLMVRAGLVQIETSERGVEFCASDGAENFLKLFESSYARSLQSRARWVVDESKGSNYVYLREQMKEICSHWPEELETMQYEKGDNNS